MFEKLDISSEVTPVLSVKSQVEEIRDSFFASKLWLLGKNYLQHLITNNETKIWLYFFFLSFLQPQ